MKANIETVEPVIRPVAVKTTASAARSTVRPLGFAGAMTQPVLFHAWRA